VVRSPDPLDRRACLLSLSGQGELYLAETYERRAENLRQILSDWTESEAETASSSVQHLTRALRSATPPSTGNDGRHHLDTASDITKEEH
jgi:DNA-binding MarR family transcriptional regulator